MIQGINKQMDDLQLRTAIFIMKDKTTGKPVVLTSFYGFETEEEAHEFSQVLKEQYVDDIPDDVAIVLCPFSISEIPSSKAKVVGVPYLP